MHAINHPHTRHYCEDVWHVDPREACRGRPVELAWFSPDCKHFSKAKGGKPVEKRIRGLAWLAVKWAKAVRPRVIILENVEDATSLISYTDLKGLKRLKDEKRIVEGMLPKAKAIEEAIRGGVRRVHVVSYKSPEGILGEVFTNEGTGTLIVADVNAIPPNEQQANG